MRILTSFLTILFLSGCSFMQTDPLVTPEPVIKTVTEYKTLEIYQPQLPRKIDLQDVEFFVVTPLRIYAVATIAAIIKIVFVFIFTY